MNNEKEKQEGRDDEGRKGSERDIPRKVEGVTAGREIK